MPTSNSADNNSSNFSFKNMPRPQKSAVVILSILGVVIIFFGSWQIRNKIINPFRVDISDLPSADVSVNLATQDTDGDGLFDYDETNVYQTSPYLEDSDSDGVNDNLEVANGTDPKCPTGQDCYATSNLIIPSEVDNSLAIDSGGLGTINVSTTTSEADLKNALAGQIDAPTLRKILLDNGADEATLNAISDADLLKSYQEVLNTQ